MDSWNPINKPKDDSVNIDFDDLDTDPTLQGELHELQIVNDSASPCEHNLSDTSMKRKWWKTTRHLGNTKPTLLNLTPIVWSAELLGTGQWTKRRFCNVWLSSNEEK